MKKKVKKLCKDVPRLLVSIYFSSCVWGVGGSVSCAATQGFMVKFHAAKPHHAGPTREEKQTKEEANRAGFMLNFKRPKFSFGQVKLVWK